MHMADDGLMIEHDDQCYRCQYFEPVPRCPMIDLITSGTAELNGNTRIKDCKLYLPTVQLRLVTDETS